DGVVTERAADVLGPDDRIALAVRYVALALERAVARVDRDLEVVLPHVAELADLTARLLDRERRGLRLVTRHIRRRDGRKGNGGKHGDGHAGDDELTHGFPSLGCPSRSTGARRPMK